MKRRALIAGLTLLLCAPFVGARDKSGIAIEEDGQGGKIVMLPDAVEATLKGEFGTYEIPKESDFKPALLAYFRSNLIGPHPAVASGDFNGDRKLDYALFIISGQSKWGPVVNLVILNGKKGSFYDLHRLGELRSYKEEYLSAQDNKLYKGKFERDGWYINWDAKAGKYVVFK